MGDRFKYDSLPKEVVKKTFGSSTRNVDFLARESSFRGKNVLSSEHKQPCSVFGDGTGPNTRYARFKYDSLPKEVIKKTFGVSTRNVDFSPQQSTIRLDVGVRWGQDRKIKPSSVTEIHGWEKRVMKENAMAGKLEEELARRHPNRPAPMQMSLSVPSDLGVREKSAASADQRRASKFDSTRLRCKTPTSRQLVGSLECLEDRLARLKRRNGGAGGTSRFSQKEKDAMQALHRLCTTLEQKQHATAQRILTHRW